LPGVCLAYRNVVLSCPKKQRRNNIVPWTRFNLTYEFYFIASHVLVRDERARVGWGAPKEAKGEVEQRIHLYLATMGLADRKGWNWRCRFQSFASLLRQRFLLFFYSLYLSLSLSLSTSSVTHFTAMPLKMPLL
jgi:hypothetical protein